MKTNLVILMDTDMEQINRLTLALKHSLFRDRQQLDRLDQVLEGADVRFSGQFPRDVIRLHDRALIRDLNARRRDTYVLVLPEEADASKGLISVLAPLGIALLGRRRGEIVKAQVPGGIRKLRIERVQQQARSQRHPPTSLSGRAQPGLESELVA